MGELKPSDYRLFSGVRSADEIRALLKTIDHLPFYIGAPPFGDNEFAVIAIANFMWRRFPHVTPEMLVDAFEMSAAGELYSSGKQVTPSTFGNLLNIEVIGRVLAAYKIHRETEKRQPPMVAPVSHQIEAGDNRATPEWHWQELKRIVQETGMMPEYHAYGIVAGYLHAQGKIPAPRAPKITHRYGGREIGNGIAALGSLLRADPSRESVESYLIKINLLTPKQQ